MDLAISARATHYELNLNIDFDEKKLSGNVEISVENGSILILDSRDILVTSVSLVGTGESVPYEIKSGNPINGNPIYITLPSADPCIVKLCYETSPSSSALQWLTPEQTESKRFPFVFSQCQAIHARSMLPCQDLCQVKATFGGSIECPLGLTVLMSGIALERTGTAFRFHQPVPVPPYLIALVCGELAKSDLGPRSAVWAEPAVLARAAQEFQDTENMIAVAESLCGPYRFGRFDLLVLPPSFPYGGMENPCLTFVTPTLLAGDKSQVAVIAHELAHSWSGNLVTNATWSDFWLNEGLTVFTEKKIVHKIWGNTASNIRGQEGWDHLTQYVSSPQTPEEYTKLCPRILLGEDPDDSFSVVPYEKGASFFWYLESLVGAAKFEPFIIEYFNHFACKTVSSIEFSQFFSTNFPSVNIDWPTWFHQPGMPPFQPYVDPSAVEEAQALAKQWTSAESCEENFSVPSWPSGKKCVFINSLLLSSYMFTLDQLTRMAEEYRFLQTNCEVRCGFITLMLRCCPSSELAKKEAIQLATEQGRMKYTRPMYKELFQADPELAKKTFMAHRSSYHPICAKMVARDLQV